MLYKGKNIARIFPRKTNATPIDEDAYIGYNLTNLTIDTLHKYAARSCKP